jgi:hypothetical protein
MSGFYLKGSVKAQVKGGLKPVLLPRTKFVKRLIFNSFCQLILESQPTAVKSKPKLPPNLCSWECCASTSIEFRRREITQENPGVRFELLFANFSYRQSSTALLSHQNLPFITFKNMVVKQSVL